MSEATTKTGVSTGSTMQPADGLPDDGPEWFKTAVFYEVLVRSFRDSNGDGVGDFVGLTEKLDYLQWLGVDCLWVPPFFTSPLRDGGYDVADYTDTAPWRTSTRSSTPRTSAASG
jgi:maltose alpha-D-glucosyltransferase / alpha-amylase